MQSREAKRSPGALSSPADRFAARRAGHEPVHHPEDQTAMPTPAKSPSTHRNPARRDKPDGRAAGRSALEAFCERRGTILLWTMVALYALTFSAVSLLKYRWYLYTDFDSAIFAQAVDALLRGSFDNSIRSMNWLGDHSSLNLFLVAPFVAIFRSPATILVLQSVVLALGAIAVHRLARHELGGAYVPLGFAALYLLYPAVGYTNLYEFHPEVLSTATLLFAFDALRAGRLRATLLYAVLSLLGKEDVALVVAAMGLYALTLRRPGRLRGALSLIGLAVASLALSFGVLKPVLGGGAVDYSSLYAKWGATPRAMLTGMLSHPVPALGALFVTPDTGFDTVLKLQYHLQMLLPLLFLPLASPLTLAIALPVLYEHFLSWRPVQHTLLYQYTALVSPFFIAAAVLGFRRVVGGRARGGAGDSPPPDVGRTTRARVLMGALLVASLASNALFGPLFGHGQFQLVRSEEKNSPGGYERVMARARDAMLARIGRDDGVVGGFEVLARLSPRHRVYSLHNVLSGEHTFSTRPFPELSGITAVIADMSHTRIRPFADSTTSRRLRELLRSNGLRLVDARGDLLLFRPAPADSVALFATGRFGVEALHRITYDRQLAFLGGGVTAPEAAAGGLLPIATYWQRVAPTDSLFLTEFVIVDAAGNTVVDHMRYLGYMLYPAHDWPETTTVRESYRMVLPDDLRPGTYAVGMRVGRRMDLGQTIAEPDDPDVRAHGNLLDLGRFTVPRRN
jgi:uncharacterized membrane protein